MMSTPFGKRGHFYDSWTRGQGWEKYEVIVQSLSPHHPRVLESELASGMPRPIWLQEYYCQFMDSSMIFGSDLVQKAFELGHGVEALEF